MDKWKRVCDATGFFDAWELRAWWKQRGYKTRLRPWRHWQGWCGIFWRVEVKRDE